MKVLIFSGTRADYGLLKPIVKKMSTDNFFKLDLIVSGSHLSKEFGETYKEILEDNINIEGIFRCRGTNITTTAIAANIIIIFPHHNTFCL